MKTMQDLTAQMAVGLQSQEAKTSLEKSCSNKIIATTDFNACKERGIIPFSIFVEGSELSVNEFFLFLDDLDTFYGNKGKANFIDFKSRESSDHKKAKEIFDYAKKLGYSKDEFKTRTKDVLMSNQYGWEFFQGKFFDNPTRPGFKTRTSLMKYLNDDKYATEIVGFKIVTYGLTMELYSFIDQLPDNLPKYDIIYPEPTINSASSLRSIVGNRVYNKCNWARFNKVAQKEPAIPPVTIEFVTERFNALRKRYNEVLIENDNLRTELETLKAKQNA